MPVHSPFRAAHRRLLAEQILLPGHSVLARLVAAVRERAARRQVGRRAGDQTGHAARPGKQAQIDRGMRPGTSTADVARIRALERVNLSFAGSTGAILRTASAFFAAELGHR
ncbi:MAG: hypothetical protein ACRDND_22305 [Streptosporangiaceae bacterium]